MMRDTIHCIVEEAPDEEAVRASVQAMVEEVQTYVPGYLLKNGPVFERLADGRYRISTFLEVTGLGDFLPEYAGNLDIMTAAALRTGELIASLRHEEGQA
jgi:acetaldehyde/propanal dehydrogenase